MTYYEIVWTLYGQEWSFGTYTTLAEANDAFDNGRPRVSQLVHGGKLRIDVVIEGVTS